MPIVDILLCGVPLTLATVFVLGLVKILTTPPSPEFRNNGNFRLEEVEGKQIAVPSPPSLVTFEKPEMEDAAEARKHLQARMPSLRLTEPLAQKADEMIAKYEVGIWTLSHLGMSATDLVSKVPPDLKVVRSGPFNVIVRGTPSQVFSATEQLPGLYASRIGDDV